MMLFQRPSVSFIEWCFQSSTMKGSWKFLECSVCPGGSVCRDTTPSLPLPAVLCPGSCRPQALWWAGRCLDQLRGCGAGRAGRAPLCLHPSPIPLRPRAQGTPPLSVPLTPGPVAGHPSAFSAFPGSPCVTSSWAGARTWCKWAPHNFTPTAGTLPPSLLPGAFAGAACLSAALTADPALWETARGPPP